LYEKLVGPHHQFERCGQKKCLSLAAFEPRLLGRRYWVIWIVIGILQ
jgi:hypothetical protein